MKIVLANLHLFHCTLLTEVLPLQRDKKTPSLEGLIISITNLDWSLNRQVPHLWLSSIMQNSPITLVY